MASGSGLHLSQGFEANMEVMDTLQASPVLRAHAPPLLPNWAGEGGSPPDPEPNSASVSPGLPP